MYDIIIGRNESDRKKYGTKGAVLIAKHYVKMGQTTSLSNKVYMDITRSHVIFVCGKRGCLTEETMIFTDKGYKKIIDFNEKKDKILSFNKEKKIFEWETNTKLLKYDISNKEKLFEITFEDGQTLKLTQEHPLLINKNNKLTWMIASELNENDKIVSVLQVKNKNSRNKYSLRVARLLGFLLADGSMQIRKGIFKDGRGYLYNGNKARLRITNCEPEILKTAREDLMKEFNVKATIVPKKDEYCFNTTTYSQKVINFFEKLGIPRGKKDSIIRIPQTIWESNDKFKKEFLKAVFSCDGFVSKEGSRVMYYSNSKLFILDLQLLLTHFSIHSRFRTKKTKCNGKSFNSYQLDISDYESVKLFGSIGFFQDEKNKRIQARKFHRMKRRKSTEYINDNLFTQKIKSINQIENISKVYDLRVPINHSFIANGIISHNSGKSYTLGTIAEGLIDLPKEIRNNLSIVLVDTMGIYWTMKYPNKKDEELLKEWDMSPKGLDVKIYTPKAFYQEYKDKGIPTDVPFTIAVSELSGTDWCMTFEVNENDPYGVLIDKVVNELKDKEKPYDIDDIIAGIDADNTSEVFVKAAVRNHFDNSKKWGLFEKEGTHLKDLVKGGQVTVLDVSCYATMPNGWNIKSLVLGLTSQKLFEQRMIARKDEEFQQINETVHFFGQKNEQTKEREPLVWLVIDEAHEFLPREGKTTSSGPLITILREGRQPGISLILATQQPGKIHTDVMTQSDTVLSHRITAKIDVDALSALMQSYMRKGLDEELDALPRVHGAAVIFDDTNEKMYPIRVRPRITWHGGESPTAMQEHKDLNDF